MVIHTKIIRKSRLAVVAAAAGLMCWAAAFTSLADTTEIGPGVGMPLADGLSQEYMCLHFFLQNFIFFQ